MDINGEMDHKIIPDPPLNIVLYQPEIPANTGNIARLCGAAEVRLHLIHPLGFRVDDKHLKRAGLDYWKEIDVRHHDSFDDFLLNCRILPERLIAFSRHAIPIYIEAEISHGDFLLFGRETQGLPDFIREKYKCYRIPIMGNVRSLNLSTAVGIVTYHYLNQLNRF